MTDLISLIDLTSLNTVDNSSTTSKLITMANIGFKGLYAASVCVYPKFAKQIKANLHPKIKSCSVCSYFPTSQAPIELKLQEIEFLDTIGVDEIDIVLPIGDFLAGNYNAVSNELLAIRKKTDKDLKLIIETCMLKTPDLVEKATILGINADMNFIKTSTGKAEFGADMNSTIVMAKTIKSNGGKTGLKIAGGIKTRQDAMLYINSISQILGEKYINPSTFRIGASNLYNQLIEDK
ncbi:MAG: deoxyribose-phosphate aldolase [Crocinitomicaceae bacterium]